MSIFKLNENVVQETETDSLGGGLLDSALYDFKVEMAYLTKVNSGAMQINLTFKTKEGKTLRERGFISSGDAKGNKFTYTKEGKEYPLPDFAKLDTLCKLAIGKSLQELEPEQKTVKVYDSELKKEVPTQVPVLMDLIGADITAGVLRVIEDKTSKDSTGTYTPTGETRETNIIDKYFRTEDKLTVAEIKAEATEAAFYSKWEEKYKGKVINKAKGVAGNSGTAGAPKSSTPNPTKSLFS